MTITFPQVDYALVRDIHAVQVDAEILVFGVADVVSLENPHLADVIVHLPQVDGGLV